MLIDWFTVVAQIINFLILVVLLRRFLYGPIIKVMGEREARITARLQEADQAQAKAEEAAASYRRKSQELEAIREEMVARARAEAEEERKALLAQARMEVEAVQERWHEAVQREKALFLHELRRRAGAQVCTVARRALADMADTELEQRMIDIFIQRIRAVSPEERAQIVASIRESGEGVRIRSAFPIPVEMRHRIRGVAQEQIGGDVAVQFDVVLELIAGIELLAPGHRVAWSLQDYLGTLEQEIAVALESEIGMWNEHEPYRAAIYPG